MRTICLVLLVCLIAGGVGAFQPTGWFFSQWPYCYSMTSGGWFYMDTNSVQWCVNLNDSRWSKFGQADHPSGMVLIPAGSFVMGDSFGDGGLLELPQHSVTLSEFYMGRCEVTKEEWVEVYNWAIAHGYDLDSAWGGHQANHPSYSHYGRFRLKAVLQTPHYRVKTRSEYRLEPESRVA